MEDTPSQAFYMQIILLLSVAWERTQNRMSAHVIPEGPGTPKRQKFPFLRGSLGFGAREAKTGITSIACSIATCMTRGVGHRLASLDVFWVGGRQIACLPSTSYDMQIILILSVAVVISAANYHYETVCSHQDVEVRITFHRGVLRYTRRCSTVRNHPQQTTTVCRGRDALRSVPGSAGVKPCAV